MACNNLSNSIGCGYLWPCDCVCPPQKQYSVLAQGQDNYNKNFYSESRRMGATQQSLFQSNFEFVGNGDTFNLLHLLRHFLINQVGLVSHTSSPLCPELFIYMQVLWHLSLKAFSKSYLLYAIEKQFFPHLSKAPRLSSLFYFCFQMANFILIKLCWTHITTNKPY